jgi:hypothetical protein
MKASGLNITDKELSVLKGIVLSNYGDSNDPDDMVGQDIWSWSIESEYAGTPSCGGIVASLVKKGLAEASGGDTKDEDCVSITQAGADVLRKLAPEMFDTQQATVDLIYGGPTEVK